MIEFNCTLDSLPNQILIKMQVIRLTTTEVKEEDRLGEINVLRFS